MLATSGVIDNSNVRPTSKMAGDGKPNDAPVGDDGTRVQLGNKSKATKTGVKLH